MRILLSLLFSIFCSALYSNPIQKLFLHIDKSIYVENENICFAAYLTGGEEALVAKHKILAVVLFRDDERSIIKSGQFVMQGGVASGLITVPDTIAGGNYHLYAYTDIVDKAGVPLVSFIGKIMIRNTRPQKIVGSSPAKQVASVNNKIASAYDTLNTIRVLIETNREAYAPRETVKLKISLKDQDGQPLRGLFSIAALQTNRLVAGYKKINVIEKDSDQTKAGNEKLDTTEQSELATYDKLPLNYSGQVIRNRKPLKKTVELVMLNTPGISTFQTDEQGRF
ncbi:MAG: hypothetical protein ABW174_13425, partial [Flavitalea sp.]